MTRLNQDFEIKALELLLYVIARFWSYFLDTRGGCIPLAFDIIEGLYILNRFFDINRPI